MRQMTRPSLASLSLRLVLGLGPWPCALGCSEPITSLDTDGQGTTAAAETTTTGVAETTGASEGEGTTGGAPVVCAPACAAVLVPTWTYEGPWGHYAVVEMLRDDDGSLWLGTQRSGGAVGLAQLSSEGELMWSANPGLPCDGCQLADIALHPTGDVLLSATAPAGIEPAQAVIARFDVAAREVAWVRTLALSTGESTRPRIGELAVLDDDRIVAPRINGDAEYEMLEVLDFTADGELRALKAVDYQPGSGDQWRPLAVHAPTGELVLAHAWWDPEVEQMVSATTRLVPPNYSPVSQVPLPLPLDDLAVDGTGRRLELSRSDGTESVTLLLTSRSSADLERWSVSLPLLSTSNTRAALAVAPDDEVYVATRTTPRTQPDAPFVETTLEVARWSADGMLRWQAARPLNMMATSDPLELVVDDDHGVIVGTVVEGQPHVARYEQACVCE
jgi:hypothetical protein